MSKRQRELVQLVESEGLQVVSIGLNGRTHYELAVRTTDGRERKFTTALSPSDRKGNLNFRTDVRKFVRGVY